MELLVLSPSSLQLHFGFHGLEPRLEEACSYSTFMKSCIYYVTMATVQRELKLYSDDQLMHFVTRAAETLIKASNAANMN